MRPCGNARPARTTRPTCAALLAAALAAGCGTTHEMPVDAGTPLGDGAIGDAGSVTGDAGREPIPETPCMRGGWCWVEGTPVVALDGPTLDATYAADARADLWRWTGSGWSRESNSAGVVRSLYVGGAGDVWAVLNEGTLTHYDGTRWTASAVDGAWFVVGSGEGSNNVWASDGMDAWRYEGATWRPASFPAAGALTFSLLPWGESEAYMVVLDAGDTYVAHFDGSAWSRVGEILAAPFSYDAQLVRVDGSVRLVAPSVTLALEGGTWVEVADAPAAGMRRAHVGVRGVVDVPSDLECAAVPVGDAAFCFASDVTRVFHRPAMGTFVAAPLVPPRAGPLPATEFERVAPGMWAGDALRSWGTSPDDTLRFRPSEVERVYVLERVGASGATPVLDGAGAPFEASADVDIDGVRGEPTWVVANDALFVVAEGRAARVTPPVELGTFTFERVLAESGERAWALGRDDTRELLLRVDAGVVTLDRAWPRGSLESSFQLSDLAFGPDGALWLLAVEGQFGRTAGRGALLIRTSSDAPRHISLWDDVWGFSSMVADDEALYLAGGGVFRLPFDELVMIRATPGAELFDTGRLPSEIDAWGAELWVGAAGAWMSRPGQAIVLIPAP